MTYCERIDATFWAEPVNAVTNLAFIVAAMALALRLSRDGQTLHRTWDLWLLASLVAAIGIGSFLWHTLATPWSALADVIPIMLFISVFLLSFLLRIVLSRPLTAARWVVAFLICNMLVMHAFPPGALNGSLNYVPTWATLWVLAAYCWQSRSPAQRSMLAAGVTFTLSLALRTVDVDLCPAWPLGTHFAWHLLNGLVLYLVTSALIETRHPT